MSSIESRLGNLRRSGVFTTSTSGRLGFLDSSAENLFYAAQAGQSADASFSFSGSRDGGGETSSNSQQQQQQPPLGMAPIISVEAVTAATTAATTVNEHQVLQAKYRSLKHQYAILDAASRSSATEREKAVTENKGLKFQLAKSQQAYKLSEMEVARLQSQIVAVQATMTEFAAQAKRDRDEAVSEAKRLMRDNMAKDETRTQKRAKSEAGEKE